MGGYFNPAWGPVDARGGGNNPVARIVEQAANSVFYPNGEDAAPVVEGQDPRYRFDPAAPVAPIAVTREVVPGPAVAVVARPSNPVIHEAGYRPDSFPTGDVRSGLSVDRSRGTSGVDWVTSHTPGDREVVRAPSSGPHTQGELEGMANARRMLDAAYGAQHEAFDPVAAQVEALDDEAKLKLAKTRAEDPVAFAAMQAEIPAQAQTNARLRGGLQLANTFKGFDSQLQELEAKRAELRATPAYQAATPAARAQAEAKIDSERERIHTNLRVMQQALGFTTGQTPATLYAEQLGG